MSVEVAFRHLVDILKKSTISDEGGYLVAELERDLGEDDFIREQLSLCSYTKIDGCISHFDNSRKLYINRAADAWGNKEIAFYQTHSGFWQQIRNYKKLPDFFFVMEDNASSCDTPTSGRIYGYKAFFLWKELLSVLSDHCDNNQIIIFISNDKGGKKIELPVFLNFSGLDELDDPVLVFESALKLKGWLDIKDAHEKERLSVMRTALAEVIDTLSDSNSIFLSLMKKAKNLLNKYDELYDIYTKRFSINKILNELDEKSLEYTSKINEYISSSQNKALTIPGALIAVGALAKVGGLLEGAIILGGLWMIKRVTVTANDIYRDSFSSLEKRLENAFRKYLRFDEGKEIRENAIEIEADIRDKVDKARKRLDKIDSLATYMLWGGVFYLVATLAVHYNPDIYSVIKVKFIEIWKNIKVLNSTNTQ